MASSGRSQAEGRSLSRLRLVRNGTILLGVLVVPFATVASARPAQLVCFGSTATIVGTEANDTLRGTPGDDVIVALGGDDEVDAREGGSDKICGDAGSDNLVAGSGNDQLDGGPDLDGLLGGPGDDTLVGGDGVDLVAYFDNTVAVEVSLASGQARGAGTDTLTGVEAIAGSPLNDILEGDPSGNFFFPYLGDDVVRGAGGFDLVAFLAGVRANLTTGRATGEGSDQLSGIEGMGASTAASVLVGDRADNFLVGSAVADTIQGGPGNDTLIGLGGDDRISGDAGVDLVEGGTGADTLDGSAGLGDIVSYVNSGPVTVDLAKGRSIGTGTDRLNGFEVVAGSQSGDVLRGNDRPNILQGKGGNDQIDGRQGDDFLDGGGDTDTLAGGPGRDYCVDGERTSSCETRERTSPSARSPGAVPDRSRPKRASAGAPPALTPPVRLSVPTILRRLVWSAAGTTSVVSAAAASPRDGILYLPPPSCNPKRSVTAITPPRQIQPIARLSGQQTAQWQGLLTRGNRIVARTAVVETLIQGNPGVPDGFAVGWHDAKGPYQSVPYPVRGATPYRWKAEVTIVERPGEAVRHDVIPPQFCPLK